MKDVEMEVQLKLKDFLESLGVKDVIYKWNEIERFVEDIVTPAYDDYQNPGEISLEDEIYDLQNEKEELVSAFEDIKEAGMVATHHAKALVQKAIDRLSDVQLNAIPSPSVETQNELSNIKKILVGVTIDLEDDYEEIEGWDYD